MSEIFEGASEADIIARVRAAIEPITRVPVRVQVSAARDGYRNVAFDMPPGRWSAVGRRDLRRELTRAIEHAGVTAAQRWQAPRVEGQIMGSVWVGEQAAPAMSRASSL